MMETHPSEMDLQQYVENRIQCAQEVVAHVECCAECQANILAYRSLFQALKELPVASFDFDVAGLVMAGLPASQKRIMADRERMEEAEGQMVWMEGQMEGTERWMERAEGRGVAAGEPMERVEGRIGMVWRKTEDRQVGSRLVMSTLIFCIISIPAYLFRKNAFYVFTGISVLFLSLILTAALIIVLSRILTLYKRYQERMEVLV